MRALILATLLVGCQSADYQNGDLVCGTVDPVCPTGFHCASDNTCWLDGQGPGLDMGMDMAMEDMTQVDLRIVFDLLQTDSACPVTDPASCCGTLYNACGERVDCTGTCAAGQWCGGLVANQCGCPATADGLGPVYRAVAGDGSVCYSTGDTGLCPGFTQDSTPAFFVYQGDPPPSTVPLLRCQDGGAYWITLDATCGGSATAVQDLTFGYVPLTAACGSSELHRYNTSKGQMYFFNPTDAPSGSSELTPPFYVWTN
jgi:hypothetical protein